MLSVGNLVDIKYIPAESDISLKLLVDFYEDYLCKRIFIFTLRDGQVVKLFFRDATELFHVSGIDHVYEGIPMDGSRFIQEIKSGNIDLSTVKNVNAAAYKDYEIRIRSMACIDTIIKNCEYLWYPSGKIPGSDIEVKYLLLKGLDERLKVSKVEIRDKDTNQILVLIERELAEQAAMAEVEKYAEEWFSKELPILLKHHFVDAVGDKVLAFFEQHTGEDLPEDKILDRIFVKKIVTSNPELMEAYEELFAGCIRTADKKVWGAVCRKYLEQNKPDIKIKVEKLDYYWTGKITGEAIRKYEKEKWNEDWLRHIAEYSSSELVNVVADLIIYV